MRPIIGRFHELDPRSTVGNATWLASLRHSLAFNSICRAGQCTSGVIGRRGTVRLIEHPGPTHVVAVHQNRWCRYSALLPPAMGTEVAVESDPRLAGLETVHAWEETRIAGRTSRCLSSFPGLLDLCAAPLLECVHGVSGEGSPSSPLMSAGLKLLGGKFCMAYAGLHAVFESLERPALLSLLMYERLNDTHCQWSSPAVLGVSGNQIDTNGRGVWMVDSAIGTLCHGYSLLVSWEGVSAVDCQRRMTVCATVPTHIAWDNRTGWLGVKH